MSLHLATDGIIQEIAEVLHVATLVLPCASSAVSSASAPNTSFIAACVGWDRTRMDGIQGAPGGAGAAHRPGIRDPGWVEVDHAPITGVGWLDLLARRRCRGGSASRARRPGRTAPR